MYRKSGSLVGRYFSFQMFPPGLPEATADFSFVLNDDPPHAGGNALLWAIRKVDGKKSRDSLEGLIRFIGFPEPYLMLTGVIETS